MSEPLDELYLNWLYDQFASTRPTTRRRSYWGLARILYTTEFVWFVPNDDNRVEDGRGLRHEFLREQQITDVDPDWMQLGCSFLEMLVAMTRRLSFEAGQEPRWWFWKLLENLGLQDYSDAHPLPTKVIRERLDAVIWRTYEPDGKGGLFPLANPSEDQRTVELWYQLNTYLLENEYV